VRREVRSDRRAAARDDPAHARHLLRGREGPLRRGARRHGRPAAAGARIEGRDQDRSGGLLVNIAEIFIKRPVMTTLVMAGILIFGIMGYRLLAVSDLPNVDFPTIQVAAQLPGASPETMASSVATPLERQFSTIAGLDNMSSTSSQGSTQITLQFNL